MATGELKKLTVEAYRDIERQDKIDEFVAMFNPASFNEKFEIQYEANQGRGTSGSPQRYDQIRPQEYRFELLFDGTGTAAEKKDVADEINRFLRLAAEHNGEIHRPNYLKLVWGGLRFNCVLKSAEISYTMFRPEGRPLRAKVTVVFLRDIDDQRRTAYEDNTSPDLTHYRVVQDGDTLPLMCYRIYGDPSYYPEVARMNQLTDFRNLAVGSSLLFPPVKPKNGKS